MTGWTENLNRRFVRHTNAALYERLPRVELQPPSIIWFIPAPDKHRHQVGWVDFRRFHMGGFTGVLKLLRVSGELVKNFFGRRLRGFKRERGGSGRRCETEDPHVATTIHLVKRYRGDAASGRGRKNGDARKCPPARFPPAGAVLIPRELAYFADRATSMTSSNIGEHSAPRI